MGRPKGSRNKRRTIPEEIREARRLSVSYRWRRRGARKRSSEQIGRGWELYREEARRLGRDLPTHAERIKRAWALVRAERGKAA